MRRTYNVAADVRTTDTLEQTRRLHKGITDIGKRLDEQKNRALTIADIFTPSGEALRVKLKEYCVRLITKDPVGHARKTEELLWRKAFYDIVYAAKKLRKGNAWTETDKALLTAHLAAGVGFYHHLILKLQLEYGLVLIGAIDFAFTQSGIETSNVKNKTCQPKIHTEEVKQCVMRLIHRSLVCLGDLARYKLELVPYWDPMIANRYYKMAIAIDPSIGMPHNQLGTVASSKNYGLDAVYHYIRCVLCPEPFEGAEGNLKRAIITYSICTDDKCPTHMCISRLFSLLQVWEYDVPNSERINQECQDLLNNIETCLTIEHYEPNGTNHMEKESNIEIYLQKCKNKQTDRLTDDMLFKIMAICLMSISRLKSKESSEVQGVVAITLAILSQLVQFTITQLQESFIDIPLCNTERSPNSNIQLVQQSDECNDKSQDIQDTNHIIKKLESNGDNNFTDLNDNNKMLDTEKENSENNGDTQCTRKTQGKTKSLLTKLRRRKRRNSSDSDTSDVDRTTLEYSSDEINSDVSETDDVLSEENALSDDALSDDNTDDEGAQEHKGTVENAKEINGHSDTGTNVEMNNSMTVNHHVQNGDQIDTKLTDKDLVTNSVSAVTVTTNSSDNYENSNGSPNTVTYVAQFKKKKLDTSEVLNILVGKEILAPIKICFDWLMSNPDIIRMCGKSSRTLLKRIMILLNLINMDVEALILKEYNDDSMIMASINKLKESIKTVPLPEDIDLKGLTLLEAAHKSLDWQILHKYKINKREESLLRVLKLIEFGHFLCSIDDAGVKYEESQKCFTTIEVNTCNEMKGSGKDLEMEHPRGKLMRHMGKLWLKAEVCALETRLRSRLMSPYLVPDHEALAKHTPALKRLVYAKKFIVVIPSAVVSALDEVKRVSGRAREATRWLETQLRRGSRFLRAQRPNERLALPLIKGPKPKDKEAWLFFQIIECCHYLTQQTKGGLTNDAEAPVVTLLTGCSPDDKKILTFSPEGLANSAGVHIEHIESFQTKWKASSKSHG